MREPDPMSECRPGGTCPTCNAEPFWCQGCLEVEVETYDSLCDECADEVEDDRALNLQRETEV